MVTLFSYRCFLSPYRGSWRGLYLVEQKGDEPSEGGAV